MIVPIKARCPECGRVFDLLDEEQAEEWYYGHDCEEQPIQPGELVSGRQVGETQRTLRVAGTADRAGVGPGWIGRESVTSGVDNR